MEIRDIEKQIEPIETRVTRITIPTKYRENFNAFLAKRKVALESPAKTDVWNGVESAFTVYDLSSPLPIASSIFDEWLAGE